LPGCAWSWKETGWWFQAFLLFPNFSQIYP
jgi:hypothetical protein